MGIQLPYKKGTPPIFGPYLLWQTAGWIKVPLGTEVGLGADEIVLDGAAAPLRKRGMVPNLRPMSIVAKRLDG